MEMTRSGDGTVIAFDRVGAGAPVVLVCGASTTRGVHAELAGLLAGQCTVFNYDRRGRGDSGDTEPYAVEREIEDLRAVLAAAGGEAAVFGNSSGAVLALRAAAAGAPISRLALWEPPLQQDPDAPRRHAAYVAELDGLLGAGRRGDAVALFLRTVGLPDEMIAGMRGSPMWPGLEAVAPTLAYDAAVMGDGTVPVDVATAVRVPTLVLYGSESGPWAGDAAAALVAAIPDARSQVLEGQDHNVSWPVLAPVLREFLAD